MEIEGFSNGEARVRHKVEEVEKIAGALISSGEVELADSFTELHGQMTDGQLHLMRPLPRRRTTVADFLSPEEGKELAGKLRQERRPLSGRTIARLRRAYR